MLKRLEDFKIDKLILWPTIVSAWNKVSPLTCTLCQLIDQYVWLCLDSRRTRCHALLGNLALQSQLFEIMTFVHVFDQDLALPRRVAIQNEWWALPVWWLAHIDTPCNCCGASLPYFLIKLILIAFIQAQKAIFAPIVESYAHDLCLIDKV